MELEDSDKDSEELTEEIMYNLFIELMEKARKYKLPKNRLKKMWGAFSMGDEFDVVIKCKFDKKRKIYGPEHEKYQT